LKTIVENYLAYLLNSAKEEAKIEIAEEMLSRETDINTSSEYDCKIRSSTYFGRNIVERQKYFL